MSTDVLNVFAPTSLPVVTAAVSIMLGPSITCRCLLRVVTVVLYPPADARVGVVTFDIVNSTIDPCGMSCSMIANVTLLFPSATSVADPFTTGTRTLGRLKTMAGNASMRQPS